MIHTSKLINQSAKDQQNVNILVNKTKQATIDHEKIFSRSKLHEFIILMSCTAMNTGGLTFYL